jgi:hypothetical protein
MSELADVPPGVDPTRPSPARLYDYFLGGTNNFPADREAAAYLKAYIPDVADAVWANRGFHGRAAVWMARQGIQQFLDIGSGLPTQNNTHESVHKVAPHARVVYVDNDPMVAAMPPGSYLALSHGTNENLPPIQTQATADAMAKATANVYPRSRAEVARFFDGLELVSPYEDAEPAITYAGLWGAEDLDAADTDGSRGFYCGVARRTGSP